MKKFCIIICMKKKFLISLISLVLLTGCGQYYYDTDSVYPLGMNIFNFKIKVLDNDNPQNVIMPFDTSIFIKRYQKNNNFNDISVLFNETFQKLHVYFDVNYKYSINGDKINNLKVINESYGQNNFLEIPFELYDIIDKSIDFSILSKGKYNIAIGELATLWNNYIINSENNYSKSIPSEEEIKLALNNTPKYNELNKLIELKEENNKYFIKFNKLDGYEKVSLSLGAVGKGYANDVMKELLNDEQGYISSGESLITFLSKPIGDYWNLKLTNPLYMKKYKMKEDYQKYNYTELKIQKNDQFSISTSGDYERFFYDDNKTIYHHIIDPISGYPSGLKNDYSFTSISAITEHGIYADMITTALMNMNLEDGMNFVKEIENKYQTSIYPIWLEENNNKITAYVDNNLINDVSLNNENNNRNITTIKSVKH